MATQRPISTISYNTESFLKEKLDSWVKSHIIQAYQYICHVGEEGDKNHIHLRVEPNKKLDQMDLTEALREYEKGNDKPLGVRPWVYSKEADWFLYAVHDKQYLELKYHGGEKGEKLPYEYTCIKVSDYYDLDIAFIRAKSTMKHTAGNIISRMKRGESPLDMISSGENAFLINTITHVAHEEEFSKLYDEISKLRDDLDNIICAIEKYGLCLEVDDTGNYRLTEVYEKIDPSELKL